MISNPDYIKENMDKFNQVLSGIKLTPGEEATLSWLCGWNASAVENMVSIIEKVKNHDGQAETADKLYEALNIVKEHCAAQSANCEGCLLNPSPDFPCGFMEEIPEDWDLEFLNQRRSQTIKKDPTAGTVKVSK